MRDESYFNNPATPRQKQYEVVRSIMVNKLTIEQAVEKFGYKILTIHSLLRDFRSSKLELFPIDIKPGPTERRTSHATQDKIIAYRKQLLSCIDIAEKLEQDCIKVSIRTIENILVDAGFDKLPRRSNADRGLTVKEQLIPKRAMQLDFDKLQPFTYDCPIAGVYFFIPYIVESGIIDILTKCTLPTSSDITAEQACLSMMFLKLTGNKRLSHMGAYDHEPGLGVFSGLTVLPKSTYMSTYSCRTSEMDLYDLQKKIVSHFKQIYPQFYNSEFINLDFHSIPHFGDESQMEKVWCGAKNKTMKGANTLFAQDSASNVIVYTKADILRQNETKEILKFISYWKEIGKNVTETLVFDCKLTTYTILDQIHDDQIKFITLRKRNKALLKQTTEIPSKSWQKIYLPIPKRKHKHCSVYESNITLNKCKNVFRQIIIKDHGRSEPTFVITNNTELKLKDVLIVYAHRWHIENKFAELASFFNLNALSSPLMIRIHFDMLWTVVADFLYHRFTHDLPRFEKEKAYSIFRKFIDMPGKIIFDGNKFTIKIRRRAMTPILLGVEKLQGETSIPWLGDKTISFEFTA